MARGRTLTEGTVADTCEDAGMKAVCNGDSRCSHYSARCQVVDLESAHCGYAMYGLAQKLCGSGKNPRQCPQMDGLFNYMKSWRMWSCEWQELCQWQ